MEQDISIKVRSKTSSRVFEVGTSWREGKYEVAIIYPGDQRTSSSEERMVVTVEELKDIRASIDKFLQLMEGK